MNEDGWVKSIVWRGIAFAVLAGLLGLAVDTVFAGMPHVIMRTIMLVTR